MASRGAANVTKNASPAVSISRPPFFVNSRRTRRLNWSSFCVHARSPIAASWTVDAAMSRWTMASSLRGGDRRSPSRSRSNANVGQNAVAHATSSGIAMGGSATMEWATVSVVSIAPTASGNRTSVLSLEIMARDANDVEWPRRQRTTGSCLDATVRSRRLGGRLLADVVQAHGQAHHEARSDIGRELRVDRAAVRLDDLPADVQAEPHPRAVAVRLEEALEQVLPMLRRDAEAAVTHRDPYVRRRRTLDVDVDATAVRAELDRVAEQVRHHLFEPERIDGHPQTFGGREDELVRRRGRLRLGDRAADEGDDVRALALRRELASLSAYGLEQQRHEATELVDLLHDQRDRTALLRLVRVRARKAAGEQLRRGLRARHRRLQLVRRDREKLIARAEQRGSRIRLRPRRRRHRNEAGVVDRERDAIGDDLQELDVVVAEWTPAERPDVQDAEDP